MIACCVSDELCGGVWCVFVGVLLLLVCECLWGGWFNVFVCVVCDCVVLHSLCVLCCVWLRVIFVSIC